MEIQLTREQGKPGPIFGNSGRKLKGYMVVYLHLIQDIQKMLNFTSLKEIAFSFGPKLVVSILS